MMNDRLASGAVSGMTAATIKALVNFISFKIGITGHTYPGLIATVILRLPESQAYSGAAFGLGILINILNGGILGVLIIYLLKKVSKRYLWFKGLFFGSLIWLIGPMLLVPLCHRGLAFDFYYTSFFDHLIFGLVTVFMIAKLYPVMDA